MSNLFDTVGYKNPFAAFAAFFVVPGCELASRISYISVTSSSFAREYDSSVSRSAEKWKQNHIQEIIQSSSVGYSSETYDYVVQIAEADLSNYNH